MSSSSETEGRLSTAPQSPLPQEQEAEMVFQESKLVSLDTPLPFSEEEYSKDFDLLNMNDVVNGLTKKKKSEMPPVLMDKKRQRKGLSCVEVL